MKPQGVRVKRLAMLIVAVDLMQRNNATAATKKTCRCRLRSG
jgi:hypothetical protein